MPRNKWLRGLVFAVGFWLVIAAVFVPVIFFAVPAYMIFAAISAFGMTVPFFMLGVHFPAKEPRP